MQRAWRDSEREKAEGGECVRDRDLIKMERDCERDRYVRFYQFTVIQYDILVRLNERLSVGDDF